MIRAQLKNGAITAGSTSGRVSKITPPQLPSCFSPYIHEEILNLFNYALCCDFTHIIVTAGIDISSNITLTCGAFRRDCMSNLKKEYTDIKDKKHKVVHFVADEEKNCEEQIIEELLNALTRTGKHEPA